MNDDPLVLLEPSETAEERCLPWYRKTRRQGWIAAALLVGVTGLWLAFAPASAPSFSVRRGDIVHSYCARGRVESETTLELFPELSARIKEIHVKEGDSVRAGDCIVTLENDALLAQLEQARRANDAAQARWDEVVRGPRAEDRAEAEALLREAEERLHAAEAARAIVINGPRAEEREEAEAAVSEAEAEAARAERDWKRMKELFDKGIVAPDEYEESERRHQIAQAQLRQALARRDRIRNGPTQDERAQADAEAAAARAFTDRARANHDRVTRGATEEERRSVEAELKRAEAEVQRLQVNTGYLTLKAPIDGTVLRRYREPGELASPDMDQPILVIGSAGPLVVRVEISEQDIYKVRVGQTVSITADGYPGRLWKGTLTRLSAVLGRKRLQSENPREKADVKVWEAFVKPGEPFDVPWHLPVEAKVSEPVRTGVLITPFRSLVGGQQVRLSNGEIRDIQAGARDDAFQEIISGLSEGDRVRLTP